jgi:RHS repeat-associated protein
MEEEVARLQGSGLYRYLDATNRLQSITAPGNVLTTNFAYYNNAGDERLQQIQNVNPSAGNSVYSQQNYGYDAFGHIQTWTQARSDRPDPFQWSFVYDNADQLTGGTQIDTVTSAVQSQAGYGYDLAGNRTLAQSGLVPANATFNNLNELGSIQTGGAGQMLVQGTVNKPVTGVTVNGVTASVSPTEIFQAQVPVQAGTNTIAVTGTDASNNQPTTKSYQVTVSGPTTRNLQSDLNGNLVSDGAGRGYVWDAQNRLASITYTGSQNHTDFTHDGLGRMIKLQELNGTTVTATRQFVWDGSTIVDERDGSNSIVRRYFPQGEQVVQGTGAPTLLYYTRDHLGTVREAIDAVGAVRARFDYDPYGVRSANSVTANAIETTFGYTGHLYYKAAADSESEGIHLSLFRGYDPILGRWLSRDPLQERAGVNLYTSVKNDPLRLADPYGLCSNAESDLLGIAAGAALGAGVLAFAPEIAAAVGIGAAVGGLFGAATGAVVSYINGDNVWSGALNGAITGAAAGGIGTVAGIGLTAALEGGALAGLAGGALGGATTSAVNSLLHCHLPNPDSMGVGALLGAAGAGGGLGLASTALSDNAGNALIGISTTMGGFAYDVGNAGMALLQSINLNPTQKQ